MASPFAEMKAEARRAIHGAFSISAVYQSPVHPEPVPLTVRWHTKIDRFGDMESMGFAEIVEGVNRLILNREQLAENGLRPMRGAVITIIEGGWDGAQLKLETREPYEGPIEEIWGVAHVGNRNKF